MSSKRSLEMHRGPKSSSRVQEGRVILELEARKAMHLVRTAGSAKDERRIIILELVLFEASLHFSRNSGRIARQDKCTRCPVLAEPTRVVSGRTSGKKLRMRESKA